MAHQTAQVKAPMTKIVPIQYGTVRRAAIKRPWPPILGGKMRLRGSELFWYESTGLTSMPESLREGPASVSIVPYSRSRYDCCGDSVCSTGSDCGD